MFDGLNLSHWVFAGWGLASGVMVTLAVLLPAMWRMRDRSKDVSAAARENKLDNVKYRAAVRSARRAVAAAPRIAVQGRVALDALIAHGSPRLVGYPRPPRLVPEPDPRWAALNVNRPQTLADVSPEPVPDDQRTVEPDEGDDYPRGDVALSGWRPGLLGAAGASFTRRLARRFRSDRPESMAVRPHRHASDEEAVDVGHEPQHHVDGGTRDVSRYAGVVPREVEVGAS